MRIATTAAVLCATAGAAAAGGIDRSGQGLGNLFEPGRQIEFSLGSVNPSVSGTDLPLGPFPGGGSTGDVTDAYLQLGLSYKQDVNERVSFAVILDQPFGADVLYGPGSVNLGGTMAQARSVALTGVMRYRFDGGFSVHGGVRGQRASGAIDLGGFAYGGVNGYAVRLDDDVAFGYLVGVAYEKPEIALRVALTYNSEIKHDFDTMEYLGGAPLGPQSSTEVKMPQSVNLDFQTGIARDTLLFGQIRWAEWSAFRIDPVIFTPLTGGGLVELEDTTTYTIGIGRRFTDAWSGSISFTYEGEGSDDLVSPLAPSNGRKAVTLAAVYTQGNVKVITGLNYTVLGDARAETGTPDTARARFRDNDAVGFGVKVAYTF